MLVWLGTPFSSLGRKGHIATFVPRMGICPMLRASRQWILFTLNKIAAHLTSLPQHHLDPDYDSNRLPLALLLPRIDDESFTTHPSQSLPSVSPTIPFTSHLPFQNHKGATLITSLPGILAGHCQRKAHHQPADILHPRALIS